MDMLGNDDDDDLVPVKDDLVDPEHVFNQQRAVVAKLSREELADRYLRLLEENVVLKKHACKQEDKIKKLATKLIRVLSDKKRLEMTSAGGSGVPGARHRDVETEELIEDQQHKIRELERQVTNMREKLMVAKQQLLGPQGVSRQQQQHQQQQQQHQLQAAVQPKRSKNSAGGRSSLSQQQLMLQIMSPRSPVQQLPQQNHATQLLSQQAHRLLEEARNENRMLEENCNTLKEQVNIFGQESEQLREEQRIREANHEEEVQLLKNQILEGQRHTATENIQLIQLHKENNHKSGQINTLRAQVEGLEEQCRQFRVECDSAQRDLKDVTAQLQDEQKKAIGLSQELAKNVSSKQSLMESEEKGRDLQKENSILRESNNKLLDSAYDLERERQFHATENALKLQVAQLETTLKSDLGEKKTLQDALVREREQYAKLEAEFQDLQAKYFTLKESSEGQEEKLRYFAGENSVEAKDLEEALLMLRNRKDLMTSAKLPSFLEEADIGGRNKKSSVEGEAAKDLKTELSELQVQFVDAINELEKTRSLLRVQGDINTEQKQEVTALQERVEQVKSEYQGQVAEYRKLLEMRAARIQKIEGQLRDSAYGNLRRQVADLGASTSSFASSSAAVLFGNSQAATSVHNASGQSLFEIHVQKVSLTQESLLALGVTEPKVFAAWSFYDHHMQYTPMAFGPEAVFDSSAYYRIRLDDSFLDYVSDGATAVQFDIHHVLSNDCALFATANISLAEIIDYPANKLHGSVMLKSAKSKDRIVGTMDYWFKLHTAATKRISQWMERKAEVERMLSAAAAKKEFAVSEAELMAGEEKAMLLAEQAQKSTPPKAKPPPKRKEPSPEPPPKAIQRELEKRVQSQRAALKTESSAEVKEEEAAPVKGHMEEMKDVEVSSKPVPKPREANKFFPPKSKNEHQEAAKPERKAAKVAESSSSEEEAPPPPPAPHISKHPAGQKLEAESLRPHPPPPVRQVVRKQPVDLSDGERSEEEEVSSSSSSEERTAKPEVKVVKASKVARAAKPDKSAKDSKGKSEEVSERKKKKKEGAAEPQKKQPPKAAERKTKERDEPPPPTMSRSKSRESARSARESTRSAKSSTKSLKSYKSEQDVSSSTSSGKKDKKAIKDSKAKSEEALAKKEETKPEPEAPPPPPPPQQQKPKKVGLLQRLSSRFRSTNKEEDEKAEGGGAPKKTKEEREEEAAKKKLSEGEEEEASEETSGSTESEDEDDESFGGDESSAEGDEDASDEDDDDDDDDDIVESSSAATGGRLSKSGVTDPSTSQDSEGLIVVRKNSPASRSGSVMGGESIAITVTKFTCTNPSARFVADESVSRLYVAYKFLEEVYDTPYSLPKPRPKENIVFNFRKVIPIDAKGRRSLSKMVSSNDRSSVVLFTVVSEPSEEEEDGVCVDVGVAEIDLGSVARSGGELDDCVIDVYDLEGNPEDDTPVGTLTVSISATEVFKTSQIIK